MKKLNEYIKSKGISRNSVLFSWLLSYMLVFFTSMVLSIGMYFVFRSTLDTQVKNHNAFLIDIVMKQADRLVEYSMIVNDLAAFNRPVNDALYIDKELGNREYFVFYELQDMLAHYSQTAQGHGNLYIYLDSSDMIITHSQTISSRDFYNRNYSEATTPYDEWLGYLRNGSNVSLKSVKYDNSSNSLLCIRRLSRSDDSSIGGAIVSVVQTQLLENIITDSRESFEYAIFDDQSLLVTSPEVRGVNFDNFFVEQSQNDGMLLQNGFFYQYKKSQNTSITYMALINAEMYNRSLATLRRICTVLIVILFILMTIVIIYNLLRNYMPLKSVLEVIKNFDFSIGAYNEYDLIKNVIKKMENENISTILQLEDQTPHVQTSMLNRLLKGSWMLDEEGVQAQLRKCGLEFPGETFAVMIIEVVDFSGLFSDDQKTPLSQQNKTVRYVIKNVTEELSQANNNNGYLCDLDESLVLLISFAPENVEEAQKQLLQMADFTINFFRESLSIKLAISTSNIYKSIKGINIAYNEALEASNYNLLLGNNAVMDAVKLADKEGGNYYYFSFEKEKLLLNYIRTGDIDSCKTLLDDIFDEMIDKNIEYMRCLAFDMIGTMMKLRNEFSTADNANLPDLKSITDKLLTWENIGSLKEYLMSAIKLFCEFYIARKNVKLIYLVNGVVAENYANQDLSVGFIAEKLKINRSYLSTVFKDQAEEGLLDYVNRYRINKSKELLDSTALGLEEIAVKVGYNNARILTRLFKKFEGMTPTQYRKI